MAEDFNPALPPEAANPDQVPQQPPANETPDQTAPTETENEPKNAKPKTKAELEAENAALVAENAALVAENIKLATQLATQLATIARLVPKNIVAKEGHTVVFIKSDRVAAIPKNGKKYLEGSVNGRKFEVQCDIQTEVPDDVAEALAGVIRNQS